jgi:hypothetical protein
MSVQLIVYPQNYEGQYNAFSTSATEALVNGISFTGLNTTTSYDSSAANTTLDVLTNEPPAITNAWYRFRTTSSGTPTLPTVTSNNLVLNSTTTLTLSGVYQRLTNLSIGQQYTFTINISTSAVNGSIVVSAFNGTSVLTQQLFSASLSQITHSFTATSTDNTIMISYYNSVANNVTISDISIQPQGTSPNLTNFELEDGQVICDLYEDEDIPLSLSVDNFKNVAEKVQSYSKAFKLPATKRNNLIFDNMFEITRSDDGIIFNPYNKTECVLKQDGFILFKGYLKMLDINDKEGEISYNVNLYSEVVALADILKDRTFSDLDFSELTHDYNYTEIRDSWDGTLGLTNPLPVGTYAGTAGASTTGVLKYPFVSWNQQYTVVPPGTGNPVLPNLESAFRPFIKLKYLINRIFAETPFTWESSFFDTADFGNLYMDFNWGADNTPTETGITTFVGTWRAIWPFVGTTFSNYANTTFSSLDIVPFTLWAVYSEVPPNYDTSTNIITATVNNETYNIDYSYTVENVDTVDRTVELRWLYNTTSINPSTVITLSAGSTYTYVGNFNQIMQIGDTLVAQFKSDDASGTKIRQYEDTTTVTSTVTFNEFLSAVTSDTILQTLRGELGQWDFLKGIMTMFNLVSLPDEDNPNNIKFEPYGDVFISDTNSSDINNMTLAARSIQHDWTDKLDIAEMKLTPLTDLNKNTIFKFVEDDEDFAFTNYKNLVGGHLYGSKKFDASLASNGLATVLQGTEEIIAEPFAATVVKPLMEQYSDFIIPSLYAMSDDETEGFDNSPRILYDNGKKTLTSCTYDVPAQNGVAGDSTEDEFLQFSHLSPVPTIPAGIDFHFGDCQLLPGVGAPVVNNLFNLYWLPYYKELYNADTRAMSIKVNLSPSEINTFKFNDTVMIKNREFRVNKIDYKPNDLATVEFILIP